MNNVADVYPLSPMQSLMLLNTTSSGASRDSLLTHFCYEMHGRLDPARFEAAWQILVDRHPALRTVFLWDGLKAPVQVVRETVELPFRFEDWSALPAADFETRLHEYRKADAAAGFDPTVAPLIRVALVRLTDSHYYLVWTTHHLILDRWSIGPLFDELARLLDGPFLDTAAERLSAPVPFSRYIRWLQDQDEAVARAFWVESFRGFQQATRLTRRGEPSPVSEDEYAQQTLAEESCRALRQLAVTCGVTLSVAVQAAWSLLLNRLTAAQDLCYGAAVSGRPPAVSGVDQIVGTLVSNLPVRVTLPADITLGALLTAMSQQQQQRSRYEHNSPAEVLGHLDLGEGLLFDSILVWLSGTDTPVLGGLNVAALPGRLKTAYPVTIGIGESGETLALSARVRSDCVAPVNAAALLDALSETLAFLPAAGRDALLTDIPEFQGSLHAKDFDSADAGSEPVQVQRAEVQHEGRERLDQDYLADMLKAEWQVVLEDCLQPGPEDDFFNLGGDSLAALTLHANVEAATRLEVPMIGLFQNPTISGMAAFLAAGDWPLKAEIVTPLRRRGARPPIFCVASPEVNTIGYMVLTRHLDDDQPVYVLQSPPTADAVERLSPALLPELASRYVDAMREIQPHGPYLVLGMCTGCHLALDMARVLEHRGEHVAFLGMINTWAQFTVSRRYYLERVRVLASWYQNRCRQLLAADPEQTRIQRIGELLARKLRMSTIDPGTEQIEPVRTPDTMTAQGSAAEDNVIDWINDIGWSHLKPNGLIDPVEGPITVFRTTAQQYWRVADETLGWRRFTRTGAEKVMLGNHGHQDILREPHVRHLARQIDVALAATLTTPAVVTDIVTAADAGNTNGAAS